MLGKEIQRVLDDGVSIAKKGIREAEKRNQMDALKNFYEAGGISKEDYLMKLRELFPKF